VCNCQTNIILFKVSLYANFHRADKSKSRYQSFYKPLGEDLPLTGVKALPLPHTRSGMPGAAYSSQPQVGSSSSKSNDLIPNLQRIYSQVSNQIEPEAMQLQGIRFKGRYVAGLKPKLSDGTIPEF